jgi:Fe-S-cluster containining protein
LSISGCLKTLDGEECQLKGMTPIECFRCGICCQRYRPKLTLDEAEEIAQKRGMDTERFLGEYVQKDSRSGELLLRRSRNGCAFLCWDQDGRARCDIYPFRPKACRNFVASLSRPECREGLSRLKSGQRLLFPNQLYHSGKAVERLSKTVRETDT